MSGYLIILPNADLLVDVVYPFVSSNCPERYCSFVIMNGSGAYLHTVTISTSVAIYVWCCVLHRRKTWDTMFREILCLTCVAIWNNSNLSYFLCAHNVSFLSFMSYMEVLPRLPSLWKPNAIVEQFIQCMCNIFYVSASSNESVFYPSTPLESLCAICIYWLLCQICVDSRGADAAFNLHFALCENE